MAEISSERAGGPNVVAFLDMIAWSEGTDNPRQKSMNNGYDVIVGGSIFTDYRDHPRRLIQLNDKLKSTAAGRYQLLSRYWDVYRVQLKLTKFGPEEQDLVAIQQIKEQKAFKLIQQGKIQEAIACCSNIWASLPGAGYGQHEQKMSTLITIYKSKGGVLSTSI